MTEIQPRDDRLKYYENDAKIRHSFTIVDMLIYTTKTTSCEVVL